uniref:Uncharacterized protein n=1 Tax=Oryza glumipatula TaxID=40148 RepID=A0A0D9ZI90_9ORYZ
MDPFTLRERRSASSGREPPWHANASAPTPQPRSLKLASTSSLVITGASENAHGAWVWPPEWSMAVAVIGIELPADDDEQVATARAASASCADMAPPPPDPAEAMVEAADWRRHCRYCILAPWMAMSAPPPPAPCMICAAAAACRRGEVVPEGGERDELRQRGEEVGAWPVRHGVESHLYETLLEVRVLVVRPFRKVRRDHCRCSLVLLPGREGNSRADMWAQGHF